LVEDPASGWDISLQNQDRDPMLDEGRMGTEIRLQVGQPTKLLGWSGGRMTRVSVQLCDPQRVLHCQRCLVETTKTDEEATDAIVGCLSERIQSQSLEAEIKGLVVASEGIEGTGRQIQTLWIEFVGCFQTLESTESERWFRTEFDLSPDQGECCRVGQAVEDFQSLIAPSEENELSCQSDPNLWGLWAKFEGPTVAPYGLLETLCGAGAPGTCGKTPSVKMGRFLVEGSFEVDPRPLRVAVGQCIETKL
jgi:hypothetical protein